MKAICKFCKHEYPNYPDLKLHCELDHAADYRKVAEWLGKTVAPKIQTYERLAAEGMIGYQEKPNGD